MKNKKILITIGITLGVLLLGLILYDLNKAWLFDNYRYSIISNIACYLSPGKEYRPIRTPRKTDDVGGYYCVTPEEYKKDVPG